MSKTTKPPLFIFDPATGATRKVRNSDNPVFKIEIGPLHPDLFGGLTPIVTVTEASPPGEIKKRHGARGDRA